MGMDMTGAVVASQIVGATNSLASSYNQYRANNAQASEIRQTSRDQFRDIRRKGDIAASQADLRARAIQGTIRARGAASGMNTTEEQGYAGAMGALDALTIRNNAYAEAMGYKTAAHSKARGLQTEARLGLLTGGLQAAQYAMGAYAAAEGGQASTRERNKVDGRLWAKQAATAAGKIRLPRF